MAALALKQHRADFSHFGLVHNTLLRHNVYNKLIAWHVTGNVVPAAAMYMTFATKPHSSWTDLRYPRELKQEVSLLSSNVH